MWKWTDKNHIDAILLDSDSLNENILNFDYHSCLNSALILPFTMNAFETAEVKGNSLQDVLTQVSNIYNLSTENMILISSSIPVIREVLQFHVGTILYGNLQYDDLDLGYIPDFKAASEERLKNILNGNIAGYGAEVFASLNDNSSGIKLLLMHTKEIRYSKQHRMITIFIGGKYYPVKRYSIGDDPLSLLILSFKHQPVEIISLFYRKAVSFLKKKFNIDLVTFIPQKPMEIENHSFNRFTSIGLNDKPYFKSVLKCKANYSQKASSSYQERFSNVKDVFEINPGLIIKGKRILIIDDVRTTGATTDAASDLLYDNGADSVYILVLGSNQMVNSYQPYKPLLCNTCGKHLRLTGQDGRQPVYQCPYCKKIYTVKYGVRQIQKNNAYQFETPNDLNDKY